MQRFRPLQPPKLQNEILDSDYCYQEYFPSKHLQSYVACYWTLDYTASNSNKSHRIVPDGCIDIIIDFTSASLTKGAFIAGLMTEYKVINLSEKQSSFGIRFYLDAIHHFSPYPSSEFIGNHVLLEDIWGHEAILFMEKVMASNDISEIIAKVEAKLISILRKNDNETDNLLHTGILYMFAHQGMISIRSLSEQLSYSERHIRRTFQKEYGVSPKELLNIIRFQNLLREIHHHPKSNLTDIAIKYGYYDQSHFIKNFKQLYGIAPSTILLKGQKSF